MDWLQTQAGPGQKVRSKRVTRWRPWTYLLSLRVLAVLVCLELLPPFSSWLAWTRVIKAALTPIA